MHNLQTMENPPSEHTPEVNEIKADPNNYPSLLKRVQSIFIDNILVIICMFVLYAFMGDDESAPEWLRGLLFFVLLLVYEPLCVVSGGTIGNRLMGIEVRRAADQERRINIFQSYVRLITKGLFGWLSFLTIHMNKEKRAIHDLVAGSVMIEKDKS